MAPEYGKLWGSSVVCSEYPSRPTGVDAFSRECLSAVKLLLSPIQRLRAILRAAARYPDELRHLDSLAKGMSGEGLTKKLQLRALPFAAYGYAVPIAFHLTQYCRLSDFLHQPGGVELRAVESANPQIRFKIFHSYRRAGLSVAQRVDLLIGHYAQARMLFGESLFRAAHVGTQGFVLCHVNLPGSHGVLPVRLTRHFRMWREGELSMSLYDPFDTRLYTLTFSFHRSADGDGIFIGGLIGSKKNRDHIKHLTKLMQGLRPQALMLFLAQALCRYYALDPLLAVGRQGHIFSGSSREERLGFDYDAFWQEHGGYLVPDDPAIYRLPTRLERRPEAEISSHKRAQYRRRYALLDDLEADMRARLNAAIKGGDDKRETVATDIEESAGTPFNLETAVGRSIEAASK